MSLPAGSPPVDPRLAVVKRVLIEHRARSAGLTYEVCAVLHGTEYHRLAQKVLDEIDAAAIALPGTLA